MSSLSTSTTVPGGTTSVPLPTATPIPISVLVRHASIDGTSDFFPFHDIASINTNGGSKDGNFSFKRLLEAGIDGSQEITLFDTGCQTMDGEQDCTTVCADSELIFRSLENFYNCAALASMAYWTQDYMVYVITDEAERNASTIMGDGTLGDFEDRPFLDAFVGCAQDSCRNDGLGVPCVDEVNRLSNSSTARQILNVIDDYCPSVAAEINPDIFGPGVLISYVLQVCFALGLYVLLKAFTLWIKMTEKPRSTPPNTPGAPLKRRQTTLLRVETMIWRDSSAQSRTSVALATTLVEFQEAQAWFVFAVQIASILAIVVNSQEGAFWGEIVLNAAMSYHVSQNGILPMFLVQVCLHNEGIRNWHTFLGFFAEYLLACVATTQRVKFRDVFNLFQKQNEISSCGGNPSPRTYCASINGVDGIRLSFFPHPLLYKMAFLILDTVAIIILIADQLSWTLRKHKRTKNIRLGSWQAGRFPDIWVKKHWVVFKRWFWRVLELAYVIVNILYAISMVKVISAESFAANRWSYGQIIAMTVWGPVIVKMFDLVLSGPPQNGGVMDPGPPRLRIDNVINKRMGTSMDEEDDARKTIPRPPSTPYALSGISGRDSAQSPDYSERVLNDIGDDKRMSSPLGDEAKDEEEAGARRRAPDV